MRLSHGPLSPSASSRALCPPFCLSACLPDSVFLSLSASSCLVSLCPKASACVSLSSLSSLSFCHFMFLLQILGLKRGFKQATKLNPDGGPPPIRILRVSCWDRRSLPGVLGTFQIGRAMETWGPVLPNELECEDRPEYRKATCQSIRGEPGASESLLSLFSSPALADEVWGETGQLQSPFLVPRWRTRPVPH